MGDGGAPHRILTAMRGRFPLSLHGVCMSIGGPQPLSEDHLSRFKEWSTADGGSEGGE